MEKRKSTILSALLTIAVITLLLLSGPAQGAALKLSMDKANVEKGEKVKFKADIELPSSDTPIDYLLLEVHGEEIVTCKFYANGTIIDGCKGITITPESGYGYGYGYGYGFQKLKYTITLDTTDYKRGTYVTTLKVKTPSKIYVKPGGDLVIKKTGNSENDRKYEGGMRCNAKWSCSEWSACTNGQQTRTCERTPAQYCYAASEPETSRQCQPIVNLDSESLGGLSNKPVKLNSSTKQGNFSLSGITGAAIGTFEDTNNFVILLFMVLIFALALAIYIIRRRQSYIQPLYL